MPSIKEILQALLAAYKNREDFATLVVMANDTRTLDQLANTGNLTNDIRAVVMVARQEGWLHDLLQEAAAAIPGVPELARLRDSVAPIQAEAADPWKALMINGQPLVDREPLRNAVQDLENQLGRILVVFGEPTVGKTHIGNLVTWRAGENQHKLVVVDLLKLWESATNNAGGGPEAKPRLVPQEIALSLCDQLEIDREIIPPGDEQDSRWAITFCNRLQGRLKPDADYWLLFDEYNKVPVSQQAADLIKELASRVATALPRVRLALLGYDETLPQNASAATIRNQLKYLSEDDLKVFFAELYQVAGRADDAAGIAASLDRVRSRINPADVDAMRDLGQALAAEAREILRTRRP